MQIISSLKFNVHQSIVFAFYLDGGYIDSLILLI
jgi:hypothetical protein